MSLRPKQYDLMIHTVRAIVKSWRTFTPRRVQSLKKLISSKHGTCSAKKKVRKISLYSHSVTVSLFINTFFSHIRLFRKVDEWKGGRLSTIVIQQNQNSIPIFDHFVISIESQSSVNSSLRLFSLCESTTNKWNKKNEERIDCVILIPRSWKNI